MRDITDTLIVGAVSAVLLFGLLVCTGGCAPDLPDDPIADGSTGLVEASSDESDESGAASSSSTGAPGSTSTGGDATSCAAQCEAMGQWCDSVESPGDELGCHDPRDAVAWSTCRCTPPQDGSETAGPDGTTCGALCAASGRWCVAVYDTSYDEPADCQDTMTVFHRCFCEASP